VENESVNNALKRAVQSANSMVGLPIILAFVALCAVHGSQSYGSICDTVIFLLFIPQLNANKENCRPFAKS